MGAGVRASGGASVSRSISDYLEDLRPRVDAALDRLLPAPDVPPERLHEAIRYSVFAGGKRVRPLLLLLGADSLGLDPEPLLPASAALEMIHSYSLIHDDLPSLDDDDLRRGRATVHRRYDEATAILAGDSLLTLGLTVLSREPRECSPAVRVRAVGEVGDAIGTGGMIGGQMDDLQAERTRPERPEEALESIHRRKTGALLGISLGLAGLYAGLDGEERETLDRLGERIGLLFQITDDILDVEGSSRTLGKTAGKDAAADKLTYPGLYGLEESKIRRERVAGEARELAAQLPRPDRLVEFVDLLARRRS